MKRQFTMLAKNYTDTQGPKILGWWMSEKLDGQRAIWDGGCTRGLPKPKVPWANRHTNTSSLSTGLWSRLGNIIHAPDWWVDALPNSPLDGELYAPALPRQDLRSIISRHKPITYQWDKVQYHVFDRPNVTFLSGGTIDIPNCHIVIDGIKTIKFMDSFPDIQTVREVYKDWADAVGTFPTFCKVIPQEEILDIPQINQRLDLTLSVGGEGLMLRNPDKHWSSFRTTSLLKVKRPKYGEGVIRAHKPGVGKYEGMMGSLEIMWCEKNFDISGFTDEERRLDETNNPVHFMYLQPIKFKYASLTKDGIPIEARYMR